MAVCKECEHYNACLIHWSESVLRNIGICERFKSGWISVKDSLPDKGELVLCIGAKGGMFIGEIMCCDGEKADMYVPNARGGRSAKYWMHLPEAPKEE